jgi:hypothetical protein
MAPVVPEAFTPLFFLRQLPVSRHSVCKSRVYIIPTHANLIPRESGYGGVAARAD